VNAKKDVAPNNLNDSDRHPSPLSPSQEQGNASLFSPSGSVAVDDVGNFTVFLHLFLFYW
jgi:hypothetical protein